MVGGIQYVASGYLAALEFQYMICSLYTLLLLRNYALLRFVKYGTRDKP